MHDLVRSFASDLVSADSERRATIVTSRQALSVASGLELTVRALDDPGDCAKLLHRVLNIAHDGDPRVAANPKAAARISGLCGGLPRALRIVGALLAENPALPLAEVADNLQEDSGMHLKTGENRRSDGSWQCAVGARRRVRRNVGLVLRRLAPARVKASRQARAEVRRDGGPGRQRLEDVVGRAPP